MDIIYILIALIASLVIARICKSETVYTSLVACIFVGFVMGAFVKKSMISSSNEPKSVISTTVANPTLPSLFDVTTDNNTQVMSKDTIASDTVVTAEKGLPKTNQKPEIVNDS